MGRRFGAASLSACLLFAISITVAVSPPAGAAPSDLFREIPIPTPNAGPGGSDGEVFTETTANKIGVIDPEIETISEHSVPTANSGPLGISLAGSGEGYWFTEQTA